MREIHISTTMKYHYSSIRMATIKITGRWGWGYGEDVEQQELLYCWWEMQNGTLHPSENRLPVVSYKVKHTITIWPPVVIYSRGMKNLVTWKSVTIFELYAHLAFYHDLIRKEWLWPKREFIGLCAVFIRETGLSRLQEGLWGLKREKKTVLDPRRVDSWD